MKLIETVAAFTLAIVIAFGLMWTQLGAHYRHSKLCERLDRIVGAIEDQTDAYVTVHLPHTELYDQDAAD